MKIIGKSRTWVVLIGMLLVLILTSSSIIQAQKGLDPLCKNLGICEGYQFANLTARSGGDLFVTDERNVFLPRGAKFSSTLPFCSIYQYDSNKDDDAAWQCTWKRSNCLGKDCYVFRLTSLNGRDNSTAVIKAVAVVLDTNVFKVNEKWVFTTSETATYDLTAKSHPSNSITLFSVDTYYTDGDDDFNFRIYEMNDRYYAKTSRGSQGSYIRGQIFNITPPSTVFACQKNIRLNNNSVQWDSRSTDCGNLKYSKQYPLVVPSIYTYRFLEDKVDKDFGIIMNSFGIKNSGDQTWAELSAKMINGDKYSDALIQMTILGYR